MIELRVRHRVEKLTDPLGRFLGRLGFTPASLTILGLLMTLAGAVVLAVVNVVAGAWIIVGGSAIDSLDGAVARATGRASDRGAVLDSVADRVGETAMWASLAYAIDERLAAVLCVVALGGALLTSYLRAKAESVGVEGRGGLFGRAERVIIFGVGLTFGWALPMLWLTVIGTWITVGQRFAITWRQL